MRYFYVKNVSMLFYAKGNMIAAVIRYTHIDEDEPKTDEIISYGFTVSENDPDETFCIDQLESGGLKAAWFQKYLAFEELSVLALKDDKGENGIEGKNVCFNLKATGGSITLMPDDHHGNKLTFNIIPEHMYDLFL